MDRCLVDFDMLFDVDFGICKLFLEKYNNSSYLKDMNIYNDEYLKALLIEREDIEPLSIILKPEFIQNAQSLITQAYLMHEQDIYDRSILCKPIHSLLSTSEKMDTVFFEVYCKNVLQEQLVRKTFNYVSSVSERRYSDYDAFIIKYYKDVQEIVPMILRKSVYLPMCGYNLYRAYDRMFYVNKEFEDIILNRVSVTTIAMHFIQEEDAIYG